jgi:vitamin B12/bleomycin/antimicrobial peptide transport system ATP-binding/permease protein
MAERTDPVPPTQKTSYKWRRLLGTSWRLAKPYWFSKEGSGAWGLLSLVVFFALLEVYLSVQFNTWYRNFYDAMQKYDEHAFWSLILRFSILAAFYIAQGVSNRYFMGLLQNRWRRWMTRRYLDQWLTDKSHYLWQLADKTTDNPDQRIAEDVRDFTSQTLDLSIGLLNQVVSLFSFATILWALSGPLAIPFGAGRTLSVPGYMAWICLIYAVVGTWLSHRVGKPLIGLNYNQQRYEANFRFGLVRLRENGESVALSEGEAVENLSLGGHFEWIYDNVKATIRKQMHFNFLSVGYDQIAVVFPFLVAAPRYFAKLLSLGNVLQVVDSFGQVKDALSWVVQNYPTLALWGSIVERLDGFEAEIGRTKQMHKVALAVLGHSPDSAVLMLQDLSLFLPGQDRPLTAPLSMEFAAGRSLLISGPSGCGKSTLLRAVSGLWPFAQGRILLPEGASVMVLPQNPYLPVGSLRGALCYPSPESQVDEARVLEVLDLCHLAHLKDRLSVEDNWALILSVGEQQRVAWARVFLHRPQWLFLDEATSALDESTQNGIYRALQVHLPATTMISVAHTQSPREHHQGVWEFGKGLG